MKLVNNLSIRVVGQVRLLTRSQYQVEMWVRIWESWNQVDEWIKHVKHSSYGKNSDNQITIELTFIERTSTDLNKCRSHLKLVSNCHKNSVNWWHGFKPWTRFKALPASHSGPQISFWSSQDKILWWDTSCIKILTASQMKYKLY